MIGCEHEWWRIQGILACCGCDSALSEDQTRILHFDEPGGRYISEPVYWNIDGQKPIQPEFDLEYH